MSNKAPRLIFLELNEVNFDFIRDYISKGELPNFAHCLAQGSFSETTSEHNYEELEPWIQWVTAHTGLPLADHGVFRLGDIVNHEIPQVWEVLEQQGVSVGAISPMNAKNRTKSAKFFLPDPWTSTRVTGSMLARNLYDSISQVVNDNAKAKISIRSRLFLAIGIMVYARAVNYAEYFRLVATSRKCPWRKAMVLDLLLGDMMLKLTKHKKPQFVTLFLNAAAHIQHHYLFSSDVYRGGKTNPKWYISDDADPVLEIYNQYDAIIGSCRELFPNARLMIATGLHQDPHHELTYYWRLVNHGEFLEKHQLPFQAVEPRMSRDFLITCHSAEDAVVVEKYLGKLRDAENVPLFEVDNRGVDLFVMLTYPSNIDASFECFADGVKIAGFRDDIAFVAIKNGRHNGIGYFIDTGASQDEYSDRFPLSGIPKIIKSVFP